MYFVQGKNGQIVLQKNRITIKRKGALSVMTQGVKGDKDIPFKSITGIEFKASAGMTDGYIQFGILGAVESRRNAMDLYNDENTVMFNSSQAANFITLKKYIDSVVDEEPMDFETLPLPKASEMPTTASASMASTGLSSKSKVAALILCFLFGFLGAHRFYLGYTMLGIIQLVTCGGLGIWAFVDLIMIAVGKLNDAQGNSLS